MNTLREEIALVLPEMIGSAPPDPSAPRSWRSEEHQTSDLVARAAGGHGAMKSTAASAGAGVVGTLRAGAARKRIGMRADMDALPIEEETGLAYASQHPA